MGSSSNCPSLPTLLLLLFSFVVSTHNHVVVVESNPPASSPYLSPSLFFANYQKMLQNFKIFVYDEPTEQSQTFGNGTSVESLFHLSLTESPFITMDGNEAHLFYLSFPLNSSTRSISRSIRDLRTNLPYWNRTLGADHFYLSSGGIGYESDRNLVELKKNSVQISCFPSIQGKFIPHKDLTLPPLHSSSIDLPPRPQNSTLRFQLGYFNGKGGQVPEFGSVILNELRGDSDFLIELEEEEEEENPMGHAQKLSKSKFCLFFYSDGVDFSGLVEALRHGCVPVVVSDRPILDLPFMDVLRWSDIAVFVGAGGGVKEMKRSMESRCGGVKYEMMREVAKVASKHLVWNRVAQPYDAFYTVLYQLWSRRHTIRYITWGSTVQPN